MTSPDAEPVTPPVTLSQELDQVAQNRSGEAFVYETLARLALRHQLRDAVVVLPADDGGPTRVLRLDGRPLTPSMIDRLVLHPGLHCDPPRIPREDRRLVLERCHAALFPSPAHVSTPEPEPEPEPATTPEPVTGASPETPPATSAPPLRVPGEGPAPAPIPAPALALAPAHVSTPEPEPEPEPATTPEPVTGASPETPPATSAPPLRVPGEGPAESVEGTLAPSTTTTLRAFALGVRGAHRRRIPGPLPGDNVRLRVSVALATVSLAIVALGLAQVHGPVRFVVGLTFGLLVPGWAVVGWMRLAQPALELGLTVAASLTILMLSAQILITVHLWHLMGFGEVLGLVCVGSLTLQVRQHRRRGVR